jgi:hypothetical protein
MFPDYAHYWPDKLADDNNSKVNDDNGAVNDT